MTLNIYEGLKMETEKNDKYNEELKVSIKHLISIGYRDFESIQDKLHCADPKLVNTLYESILNEIKDRSKLVENEKTEAKARALTASLPLNLPAPDPIRAQWWFTLDSTVKIAEKIREFSFDSPVAFLGAPTVGHYYSYRYNVVTTILDVDPAVIKALELPDEANAICYNVLNELPSGLKAKHGAVFLDPPWQPIDIDIFFSRACDLLSDSSYLLTVLPPRFTRPSTIQERTSLLRKILNSGLEMVSLETEYVLYRVPYFEGFVLKQIPASYIKPWRKGDLLVVKYNSSCSFRPDKTKNIEKIISFARNCKKLRIFQFEDRQNTKLDDVVKPISEFEEQLSSRKIPLEEIAVWGTNKKAVNVKDSTITTKVLQKWAEGSSLDQTIQFFENEKTNKDTARLVINKLSDHLGLWRDEYESSIRRLPEEIAESLNKSASDFCSQASSRTYNFEEDGFRIAFQRDRDRILWSHSLKRLANKCQVFPVESDDHLRRRLSHSIEVMQLASTIATSFGLELYLTEAGALAHDIGHAPFGHAGEKALNDTLNMINGSIGGFNHYEHGVDIVCWLEDVYRAPATGGFGGLNLCPETIECIFKHTYDRDTEIVSQTKLVEVTKHSDLINDTSCHLEGQAIRIADKISYLISDLEDGIRMGIFEPEDIMKCSFFHHAPIDMTPPSGVSLLDQFISQRRSILKVIMEDVLNETDRRLSKLKNLQDVREERNYTIDHSETLKREINEIWEELQVRLLHKNQKVILSNMRSGKIVRELLLIFTFFPELVDKRFQETHLQLKDESYGKYYIDKVGNEIEIPKKILSKYHFEQRNGKKLKSGDDNRRVKTWDLILAKDYVASLSDKNAYSEYRKHIVI